MWRQPLPGSRPSHEYAQTPRDAGGSLRDSVRRRGGLRDVSVLSHAGAPSPGRSPQARPRRRARRAPDPGAAKNPRETHALSCGRRTARNVRAAASLERTYVRVFHGVAGEEKIPDVDNAVVRPFQDNEISRRSRKIVRIE